MNRITTFNNGVFSYTAPQKHHFESQNTSIILTSILTSYYLDEQDRVQTIYNCKIDEFAKKCNMPTINELICNHINSLPEEFWQKLKQFYHMK